MVHFKRLLTFGISVFLMFQFFEMTIFFSRKLQGVSRNFFLFLIQKSFYLTFLAAFRHRLYLSSLLPSQIMQSAIFNHLVLSLNTKGNRKLSSELGRTLARYQLPYPSPKYDHEIGTFVDTWVNFDNVRNYILRKPIIQKLKNHIKILSQYSKYFQHKI